MDMLMKKSTQNVFFTHAQIRNGRIHSNQILHINSLAGRSNIFDMTSTLVEGFWGVRKLASPIDFVALASNTAY